MTICNEIDSALRANYPQSVEMSFKATCEEEQLIALQTLFQAALDSAASSAHSVATGIIMRCSSWLSASGFPKEVQTTIEDLPLNIHFIHILNTKGLSQTI